MWINTKNLVRIVVYSSLLLLLGIKGIEAYNTRGDYNGFDVTDSLVPKEQILSGGPPRDGIPAIDEPVFLQASKAKNIKSDSRVLGIYLNGEAKAYPVDILNWHEIVNDRFAKENIVVTYCPLCGTGMAFQSDTENGFGVSGLLYNSDMLLYDRQTESLWSQIKKTAISGPRIGDQLAAVPMMHTDWQSWLKKHPDTLLLSRDTGYQRNYDDSPYLGYDTSESLFFPITHDDKRYPRKENVIGLTINGKQKVWPFSELQKTDTPLSDKLGKQAMLVHYDAVNDHAWITDLQGNLLAATRGYWFAWMAFYPDSEVFTH